MRTVALALVLILVCGASLWAEPYFANGFKVGEVTQDSAIVWTRLTAAPEMLWDGIPFEKYAKAYPETQLPPKTSITKMQHSVPGMRGQVRVVYWLDAGKGAAVTTDWAAVDPTRDFTHQFKLTGLRPGRSYGMRVEANGGAVVTGGFKTAPSPEHPADVEFAVVTGQGFWRRDVPDKGHQIYTHMLDLEPDFFVHTGDILYYDKPNPNAVTVALARLKWNRMFALPYQRAFHNQVTSYFIKDDHDTWQNDCWPSMKNNKMGGFSFEEGVVIFPEQVPMGEKTYRTFRWGKDLQVWMVEGRDYRSANPAPDGPEKTIWGAEQKAWFKRTVLESDAAFRVLISPTPINGPDRENKNDNHANDAPGYVHEGNELRAFMAQQKNMFVICGDRHWQYVSVDPKTGLREYSTGPTSMKHAGGFKQELREPMHQYLNITGGFFTASVTREAGRPVMILRHHGVDGAVLNEDWFWSE